MTTLLPRILQSLLVLLVMSVVIHGLIAAMPGDPIDLMIAADPRLTPADAMRLKALHGLDVPWGERYLAWLSHAVRGEFGFSRLHARPVAEVLFPALGRTAVLMVSALGVSLLIGVPLGIVASVRPGALFDQVVNGLAFVSLSLSTAWLGLMLMLVFAVNLNWLPAGGMETIGGDASLLDRLRHMILPVATLAIIGIGQYARHMRAAMIGEAGFDYVRTARAKGCGLARVVLRHQFRNALLPVTTILALEAGGLFSGALITETVFGWPGMGTMIYGAVMGNDFNLALAALMLATVMTLLGAILADVAYIWLDRRVSLKGVP